MKLINYCDINKIPVLGICLGCQLIAKYFNCDNPSTSKTINLKYCNVNIVMYCNNNTSFYLPKIEQNY